jgi:hypothetical protein
MEGNCMKYIEANPEAGSEQCDMQPDFVKSILRTTGFDGPDQLPIVMLSDMQEPVKLRNIQSNFEHVVVPEWDMNANPSMIADMLVVGAESDLFIGVQGSSASRNIGMLCEAFGKDVSTNYIFVKKHETDKDKWTTFQARYPYKFHVTAGEQ